MSTMPMSQEDQTRYNAAARELASRPTAPVSPVAAAPKPLAPTASVASPIAAPAPTLAAAAPAAGPKPAPSLAVPLTTPAPAAAPISLKPAPVDIYANRGIEPTVPREGAFDRAENRVARTGQMMGDAVEGTVRAVGALGTASKDMLPIVGGTMAQVSPPVLGMKTAAAAGQGLEMLQQGIEAGVSKIANRNSSFPSGVAPPPVTTPAATAAPVAAAALPAAVAAAAPSKVTVDANALTVPSSGSIGKAPETGLPPSLAQPIARAPSAAFTPPPLLTPPAQEKLPPLPVFGRDTPGTSGTIWDAMTTLSKDTGEFNNARIANKQSQTDFDNLLKSGKFNVEAFTAAGKMKHDFDENERRQLETDIKLNQQEARRALAANPKMDAAQKEGLRILAGLDTKRGGHPAVIYGEPGEDGQPTKMTVWVSDDVGPDGQPKVIPIQVPGFATPDKKGALPTGMVRQVGTADGKPVYEDAQGKRHVGNAPAKK